MARANSFIPALPGELSPQWLTDQLHRHADLPAASFVSGFELAPVGGGQGLSGELIRVLLRYEGEPGGAPTSVIAKFPTTNSQNRGLIENLNLYEREIRFYRDMAAELPIRVPRHFGSAFDPDPVPDAVKARSTRVIDRLPAKAHAVLTRDVSKFLRPTSRRYALLIEDLGAGEVHDMVSPPPIDRMMLILDHLATVHAHYWGDASLADRVDSGRVVSQMPMLQGNVCADRAIAAAVERWPELLGPEETAMIHAASESFADDVARLNRPMTLIHGDPRSDNMLFLDGDELVVLDWALPALGDPGHDLGYLLSSSVVPEDGRPMARKLTEHYHAALRTEGVEYPLDELWASVEAMCRAELVQNSLSLLFFDANYGEKEPCDYWLPRSLAILRD